MTEEQTSHTRIRKDEAREVLGRFRDPDPFRAAGDSFCKRTNLGQGVEQKGPGDYRGRAGNEDTLTEAITGQLFWEGLHDLPQEVQRPRIVAQAVIDMAQLHLRLEEGEVPEGGGEGNSALAGGERAVIIAHQQQHQGH